MATLDQSFTTTADAGFAFRYSSASKLAQEFTSSVDGTVVQVDLGLYKNASPTGNIWAEIWSDNGSDLPNAKIGDSSANVDVSTLTTDTAGAWVAFTWVTGISVVAGTKYWIVINGDYTISTTNYAVMTDKTTGGYAGGVPAYFDGATWEKTTIGTNADFLFREYVATTGSIMDLTSKSW